MKIPLPVFLSIVCAAFAAGQPVWSKPVELMQRIPFDPAPQKIDYHGQMAPFPEAISVAGIDPGDPDQQGTLETLRELFSRIPAVRSDFRGSSSYKIEFKQNPAIAEPEGYTLTSGPAGIRIEYGTAAGEFYGAQTAYQLLAYAYYGTGFIAFSEVPAEKDAAERRYVPFVSIEDHPAYRIRSVMADMGRAPYSMALLKRLVRIMGQLKLNTLHLHLYDDQLCSFRFARLPIGHENPFAIDAADLREIVRYAKIHHISVMPEMESWGHVQSIVYHYPELSSGPGMFAGASFGVGQKTYALLEQMYDEVVPCLADDAALHVGLDEAKWAVLPGDENRGETPEKMVGRIHEILMRVAEKYHKRITMHLWADHGGRPLPPGLGDTVVVEPWKYLGSDAPAIAATLAQYGGAGKTPFMMGAGASSQAFHGTYEATQVWCAEGLKYPNALGVTLCVWETNDLAGRLETVYGGAQFAWSPTHSRKIKNDPLGEKQRYLVENQMRSWQVLFPEATPAAIDTDRGPEVHEGRYVWPPLAGKAVAPTMDFVVPKTSPDYKVAPADAEP
jgi:hypothetical protein